MLTILVDCVLERGEEIDGEYVAMLRAEWGARLIRRATSWSACFAGRAVGRSRTSSPGAAPGIPRDWAASSLEVTLTVNAARSALRVGASVAGGAGRRQIERAPPSVVFEMHARPLTDHEVAFALAAGVPSEVFVLGGEIEGSLFLTSASAQDLTHAPRTVAQPRPNDSTRDW